MSSRDTHPDAHDAQIEFYRNLTPARRLELGLKMSEEARVITRDAIRSRHPEYTQEQVHLALLRMTLGKTLFRKVWPDAPELAP